VDRRCQQLHGIVRHLAEGLKSLDAIPNLFAYYSFFQLWNGVGMYHAIVRRRVVGLFAAVSNGNARPVLEGLAPRFEHFFLGDHALGGSRFTLEKTRLWYERLYRLLPDISFDLRAIRISGPPWNTLVAVDWLESNSGTDGVRTFTPGVHVVRLAWGRMTYIGIYPDTVGVVTTLQRLSRAGVAEATAEKIEG